MVVSYGRERGIEESIATDDEKNGLFMGFCLLFRLLRENSETAVPELQLS